jgi:hypothetical protein
VLDSAARDAAVFSECGSSSLARYSLILKDGGSNHSDGIGEFSRGTADARERFHEEAKERVSDFR